MTKISCLILGVLQLVIAAQGRAAEPLVGRWWLVHQEVGGKETNADPLLLRIVQRGKSFEFAYSTPVNDIQYVATSFSTRLDGSDADVKDARGNKIGSVRITKAGPRLYKVALQGPNRPSAAGSMTVSADGKTLTCESDAKLPGGSTSTHARQIFTRR